MSDRDNVIPLSEGMRERLAVRRALGGESRRRAPNATPCARHGCPHVAGEHADIRVGAAPYDWGACQKCGCNEFLEVAFCDPSSPIVVTTAPSGVRYERCRCGAVRSVTPGAAVGGEPLVSAWEWPNPLAQFLEQLLVEDGA